MSRDLQHRLHSRIETIAGVRDLPLTAQHVEDLAVDLTSVVKALLAEADAELADVAPVEYALTDQAGPVDRTVTKYGDCTSSIHLEVEEDCPAALLAAELRRQHDVKATDVPTPTHLTLTVRPQSLHGWTWWRRKLAVGSILRHGPVVTGTGHYGEVTVHLRGENAGDLLDAQAVKRSAKRLQHFLAERPAGHPW
ncbi:MULTISPECIES: hypothetical protein [Streptomyces]|uniref:hypothetical protein n=1 Tax=Streptomyces TaxID=1883 RepID=UPI0029B6C6D5|nr:hypothetical protein [Streptomyces stelliscabiei]MDX2520539.1 hypothetical protein [Streptomyces stelliscabiei]MDX2552636.1 hypothetical protein [Streptomyces stelliscabiei]MDX2661320.1 hypothetical protein [Streptomyces stelliscabiei]MDX2788801.1 hypothetical protein [Streptomyces stelliscabiei]